TALSAEFTIGEGELMAHDVPLGCAPDEYDDLISGTCSHLPKYSSKVYKTINFLSDNDRIYSFINCNINNDHFIK
ncbi:hypothetical protein, partial [Klebsiella pneumoniae]|uniref:hypothetical protein n=1 Tax=Klebsiella pneumoniae TaxID=573 RepID=UPI003B436B32